MKKVICVVGTFDTKEEDFIFLIDKIHALGGETLVLDVGTKATKSEVVDVPSQELAKLGNYDIDTLAESGRSKAIAAISKAAALKVKELHDAGKIDGIIGMGGSGGTTLSAMAMKYLPIGFPKMIVSTLGGTPTITTYNADNDIIIMNPVVDVAGVNSITKTIYSEAAGAIYGATLAVEKQDPQKNKKRIAVTMYGVTTPGVTRTKQYLEENGYEVIVFHATGTGGRALENLIKSGFFEGVVDMTTTEISNNSLAGEQGMCYTTTERCEGVAKMGIPCIYVPGAMDMCVAIGADPEIYKGRVEYHHNDMEIVTHFRPNASDALVQGKCLGEKIAKTTAETAVFFPHGGLSMLDVPGEVLYDPEANAVLFKTIREYADNGKVEFIDSDLNINDEEFALAVGKKMVDFMQKHYD